MKKVILATLISAALAVGFTSTAKAEDMSFTGNLANACTIAVVSAGVVNVASSAISTSVKAVATVTNNSAGAFTLDLAAPTDWDSAPVAYSGNTTFNSTFVTTGDNAQGSEVTTLTLTNMGSDTANVSLSGTSDAVYPAGAYSAVSVLSCNAI